MQILGMNLGYNALTAQTMPHRGVTGAFNNAMSDVGVNAQKVNVGRWERMGSAILGGFLMYRAIRQRRWSSLLFGGTGMSLLSRGVSGYCPMYGKMGVSSTQI